MIQKFSSKSLLLPLTGNPAKSALPLMFFNSAAREDGTQMLWPHTESRMNSKKNATCEVQEAALPQHVVHAGLPPN